MGSGIQTFCKDNGCNTTADVTTRDECSACGPCVKEGGTVTECTNELKMWCNSPRRNCIAKYDLDFRPKVCSPCAPCIKGTGDALCPKDSTLMKHCALCVDLFDKRQLRRDLRETLCYGCDPCYRDSRDRF